MNTLRELFVDQIKDIYSAEQQLIKALPKMVKRASCKSLKQGFTDHLSETEEQAKRLESLASSLNFNVPGKKCKAMEGLIAEGKDALEITGDDAVIDAAIIAAAQRVEHYEISAYGTALAIAERLRLSEAVNTLQQSLNEEKATDRKLTEICLSEVFEAMPDEDEYGDIYDEIEDEDLELTIP